jgi:hypothetical protein
MRVLAAAGLLWAGAATGLASVAVHGLWWGLLLAVAATTAALVALPPGWWSRLAFSLGWTGFVGWLVNPRPEGDYAVSQDAAGFTLLGLGLVVLVFGLATLPRPAARLRRVRA